MKRKKIKISDVLIYAFLLFCGLICLIPIINTVAISFSDRTSAAMGAVKLWPVNFTLMSYKNMMKETQFWTSFLVSVKRVIIGVFLNMVLSVLMAYPLSKSPIKFRSKKIYMWTVVFTMLFSGGLVPTFMVINHLRLMDTFWALVLPGAVPVFNIIILMNFFKALPESLEESAYVDGAGPWTVLLKIYLPLSKASLATISLFAIVNHWNAYFDGKIYINSLNRLPLQTYIQSLAASINTNMMASMTAEEIQEQLAVSSLTFNSAKVIVSMIPILLIYPFLQRYFVSGMVVGAVKE
ncbi:carbohydrate ABC transporter permease [Lacrimispora sp. BS-2]|uniref:Carbohydrate ABC transporter permease n=1 Tax=Lacrimispora sp. BS-2 TaxID=3151850 RepID=A0AAU7PP95_9FIRM